MQKAALFGALVVLATGCLGPSQPSSTPSTFSPSTSTFEVASGQAILFRPIVQTNETYKFDIDGTYEYHGVGLQTEDSAECSLAIATEGWLMSSPGIIRTPFNTYFGRQQDGLKTWAVVADASIGGTFGTGILGRMGPEPEKLFLVGHEQVGPDIQSNLTIRPEDVPLQQIQKGRFWCLDSLSRFTGNYLVSTYHVQADTVAWREDFTHGVLARIRATANVTGLHFDGPNGRIEAPATLWDGNRLDATFCSPQPGTWSLGADHMQLTGTWSFTAGVFDATFPGLPCTEEWTASPVYSLPSGSSSQP